MSKRILPDYDNPPAQETWMAFHFAPLKWSIPHFGAFWQEVRKDYPKFEVHPPVGEFTLEFNALSPEAVVNLPVRCWFINEASNRLLQIQSTRFFHNWRKPELSAEYLHYDDLKPHFEQEWEHFRDFARRNDIGQPTVLRCEVSYVNHLERGLGWSNFSDLNVIFPTVGSLQGREFLKRPETAALNMSYVTSDNEGRLVVSIQPAIRQIDGKEIIQLTITGSCRPASNERAELLKCLDSCREWVVRGFDDLTSPDMHKIWRKK